jgi:hypothetical protein
MLLPARGPAPGDGDGLAHGGLQIVREVPHVLRIRGGRRRSSVSATGRMLGPALLLQHRDANAARCGLQRRATGGSAPVRTVFVASGSGFNGAPRQALPRRGERLRSRPLGET